MDESTEPQEPFKGRVVIAPEVLVTIARLAALGVPGVARMAGGPGGALFRARQAGEGVRIAVQDHRVRADLYLVVQAGANLHNVGQRVQAEVTRAIHEMVGMEVASVNIHVEDVAFGAPGS